MTEKKVDFTVTLEGIPSLPKIVKDWTVSLPENTPTESVAALVEEMAQWESMDYSWKAVAVKKQP